MTRHDPVVVWLRRDLRLHDHPALSDAVASGRPVAPLFVFDPALLHGRFASPNRTWFLLASIVALRRELEARGSRLFVRVGDPSGVLPAFAREIRAGEVVVSRDHTPYGRRRDRAVATALADAQIDLRAKRGLLIHEPESLVTGAGAGYTVFGPFLRRWEALPMRDILPAPDKLPTVEADAVLFVVLVSGVVVVAITTLVFVPVALTVALTVIATDAPGARLVIVQSRACAVVVHDPALVVADTNETLAGAASDTFTLAAASGPLFLTTRL